MVCSTSRRLAPTLAALPAVAAALFASSSAWATPVNSVQFTDGDVLNVSAVIGSGSSSAYLAVDFNDGVDEAFQYNYNGTLGGYTLLQDVEAATTLKDSDTYYASFGEHFVYYVTDGSNTTAEYPALYYSVPAGTVGAGTDAQGVTFEQAATGIDNVNVTNGEIVAFDNSYSAVPTLPETASSSAVPEPATLATGTVVLTCAMLRRRPRAARA